MTDCEFVLRSRPAYSVSLSFYYIFCMSYLMSFLPEGWPPSSRFPPWDYFRCCNQGKQFRILASYLFVNLLFFWQPCPFMCIIHIHVDMTENLKWKRQHWECKPLIIQLRYSKYFSSLAPMYGSPTMRLYVLDPYLTCDNHVKDFQ